MAAERETGRQKLDEMTEGPIFKWPRIGHEFRTDAAYPSRPFRGSST